ncbi:MAG: segregation/condensation protein A [Thermocrinis sp.]|nr:segregation/condensation protein A [Thermocrinis sp.]
MLYEEEHPFAIAYRLVEEGKLDPWNVDIAQLANLYIREIRRMELLDLRVPARALSAAVFLLKKQVEVLFPEPKKRRERKYTLEEIVQMFEEESGESTQQENQTDTNGIVEEQIKTIKRKLQAYKREVKKKGKKIPIHVSKFEDALREIEELIMKGIRRFSFLGFVASRNPVPYLIGLMVLYQEGRVNAYQREPYSDIEVEVI